LLLLPESTELNRAGGPLAMLSPALASISCTSTPATLCEAPGLSTNCAGVPGELVLIRRRSDADPVRDSPPVKVWADPAAGSSCLPVVVVALNRLNVLSPVTLETVVPQPSVMLTLPVWALKVPWLTQSPDRLMLPLPP
jgi:hypothetical protein